MAKRSLYSVADPPAAYRIALAPTDALRTHRVLPSYGALSPPGAVTARKGDYFGPVVNLAARAVKVAPPGHVVVSAEVSAAIREALVSTPLPPVRLEGFDGEIQLFEVGETT